MYLFIVFFTVFCTILSIAFQKSHKVGNVLSFIYVLFLSLAFGFRYDVGVDYKNYEFYFENYHDSFLLEVGYSTLNYIVYSLGFPFYVITLTMSFITNYLVYYGIRKMGLRGIYLQLAVVIYAANTMIVSLNTMRQSLAAVILFYFVISVYKSNLYKFIIFCITASLFHISAIGFVLIFFLRNILIKKKIILFITAVMISMLLLVTLIDFSSYFMKIASYVAYYEYYIEFVSSGSLGLSVGVILKIGLSLVLLISFFLHYEKYDEIGKLVVSLFVVGLIFNVLAVSNFMWGRIGMYFYIYEVTAIPYIISRINNKKYRTAIFCLVISYCLLLLVNLIFADEASNLAYSSVFD